MFRQPDQANEPIYSVILLRHGESTGNASNTWQGQKDYPLTNFGRQQAAALAARWQAEDVTFDQIISSPLLRASQTAEIIASALRLPVAFDPVWMERDNGQLSGLTGAEAAARFPQPEYVGPHDPIGVVGESQWELYLRGGRAVHSLLKNPPRRILVVSHGAILNMVLYAMLGITVQANFTGPRFRFANCAFTSLTYHASHHRWEMWGVNDHSHWLNAHVDDR